MKGKINLLCSVIRILTTPAIVGALTPTSAAQPASNQIVYYVGEEGTWHNFDLYSFDLATLWETRLTTNPAIDNHPEISHLDSTRVVFSSNRGNGEFDIYVARVNNVDGTAKRLTSDSLPAQPDPTFTDPDPYPDRHPHWHPNGQLIIFTSRDRPCLTGKTVTSLCSQPGISKFFKKTAGSLTYYVEYKICEGMNVIRVDTSGNVLAYVKLNVRKAWDSTNADPGIRDIWIHGDSTYIGHPSFNSTGNKIVFTAAIDGEGKNWEVYTVEFDPVGISLNPGTLRRVTFGPNETVNPIKMSGGAKFSNNDSLIYFNSTRTTAGNSQIYSVPATVQNLPVTSATQLTFHTGNDYVPQPVPYSNLILITSDLGDTAMRLCSPTCETGAGPTEDFDIVLLDGQNRTIIGNPARQEMIFIPDEVSWFCGSKPNLSACTFHPRIFDVESLFLEHFAYYLIPEDLLTNYGPNYCCNAKEMYNEGFMNMIYKYGELAPDLRDSLINDIMSLMMNHPFPGFYDTTLLTQWLDSTKMERREKYIVPAFMHEFGLRYDGCPFILSLYDQVAPSPITDTCKVYHGANLDIYTLNYTVRPYAFVNLAAGRSIYLKPDTKVNYGGYLKTTITSILPPEYCATSSPSFPATPVASSGAVQESPSGNQLHFLLYPNPADNSFWIEFPGEKGIINIDLNVTDFKGKTVFSEKRSLSGRTKVFMNNQPDGIYLVTVRRSDFSGTQKIVIRHTIY